MNESIVALIAPQYAPAIGGVEQHVEMLARGLVQRGVRIEVVTTDPTGTLTPVELRDGVTIRRFPTMRKDTGYFIAPGLGWWLWKNASRFALLHAHSYHTPLALQAGVVSRWRHLPLVVTPHYHGTGHSRVGRWLHRPYRRFGNWLLHQAQSVICVSEVERRLIQDHFGGEIASVVIPNHVDTQDLVTACPYERPAGRVLVLAVGRLEFYKQYQRLVDSVPSLPPHFDVVVVGSGPARASIEETIRAQGIGGRVRLVDHLPRSSLLSWYRTADVFVSMSRHESFGLTVLEAAVAGAAIVASDIPAHREVSGYVPDGRISFVPPVCSPSDLAQAIEGAVRRGRVTQIDQSRIPTAERTLNDTMACYGRLLDAHRALVLPKDVLP